jgi:DNA mismatch repair protein MSH6
MAKSSAYIKDDKKIKKFIPNDVIMGSLKGEETDPSILLITGPNMGGKSTLLRSTCLAAIMAQIGCFVPAEKCVMTIVDRVFTRLGASDRILENKSTFFVELEETKTIVEQATKNSLVIMDELGRGTSTFDGYSIAHSVLTFLADKVHCRTLFTTHYHMLVEDFKDRPERVGLFHMKSSYEERSDDIKFLYKFAPGVAPQSFGI